MPNNFSHIGLIRLTLPNAKIIDARRHPMACCFSAFKQQFAEGHRYSYSLKDTGRYFRRLLAYCGLPFESACLRFYENDRPVRTASAQQVRRPIYRDGVGHWRHYEAWLQPLKDALGEVLEVYPDTPRF